MRKRNFFTLVWQLLAALLLFAPAFATHAADDFLDPEAAFVLSARALDEKTVEVILTIAPGYYLYREQFKFDARGATLGTPILPPGKTKFDETFQKTVETYRDTLRISVPVLKAEGSFRLLVTNQGCADKGLCYPPQLRGMEARLVGFGGNGSVRLLSENENTALSTGAVAEALSKDAAPVQSENGTRIEQALRAGKFWPVVGVFLVAGVLLSLTPCVLPMLPILSSIIVGHGAKVSRGRGFALAASYSLGMALVYTALGVAAGLAGEGLAAALQNPLVLSAFALALILLSLSMFGLYELQLPSAISGRLSEASQRMPGGRFAGVFAMGGVSALIVSPCVAAPLAGALVYLSQTRDVWLGGSALFALAAGMSVPLLLVGASAGALLPKAGAWMDEVKQFFGLLLLAVALWIVQSVIPSALVLALWGALAILAATMVTMKKGGFSSVGLWRRAAAAILVICGLMQFVGAASGGSDPLQPLMQLRAHATGEVSQVTPKFVSVHNLAELDLALQAPGKPVMLDFYADWCVSCKEMERFTFVDPVVQTKMRGALLLKADVTANNADDRALLKRFQLFGPPGTIFFDAAGREIVAARIAGFQASEQFLQTLQSAGL
jgi:thiol:disulfide interchange protein DsbD